MSETYVKDNIFYLSPNDKNLQSFLTCPVPDNEDDRVCILRQSNLLDSDSNDPEFDRYTSLVRRIFGFPIALVSLIDTDRQWFKSRVGLDAPQTHRNYAFCSYTVLPSTSEVFIVPDSDNDPRFRNNPLVTGPPFVKFYAGAALVVDGIKVGSLCIIDNYPRFDFTIEKQMTLLDIANMVSTVIKRRRDIAINKKNHNSKHLLNILNDLRVPMKPFIQSINKAEKLIQINDLSKDLQNTFNIIKSIISGLGFKLEININLYPIILNKPLYDDNSSDNYSTLSGSSGKESTEKLSSNNNQLEKCKECNIMVIVTKAQEIISYLPYSKNINWLIDHTYLGLGDHLCYPEVVLHTILHQTNTLLKKYDKLSIFIGFKKEINPTFKAIYDESILLGKLSIEFRCSGYDLCPIYNSNAMQYISMIDQTTEAIDKYYNLKAVLSDIHGSIQEIKLTKVEDLSDDSNCIQNNLIKTVFEKYNNNNTFESNNNDGNKMGNHPFSSDGTLEKIHSIRIPCIINYIKLSHDVKVLIISDDFNDNMIFCEWLRDLGYIVKIAKSGDEGLLILKNVTYDVLFVKISMTEKSGATVLQAYNVWCQTKKIENVKILNENIFIIGMAFLKNTYEIFSPQTSFKSSFYDIISPLSMPSGLSSKQFTKTGNSASTPLNESATKQNFEDMTDTTSPLDRVSAFGYGMHVYFSNPFDARAIILYLLKENKKYKEEQYNISNEEKCIDIIEKFQNEKVLTRSSYKNYEDINRK